MAGTGSRGEVDGLDAGIGSVPGYGPLRAPSPVNERCRTMGRGVFMPAVRDLTQELATHRPGGAAALLQSLRPRQWTKNAFVFAGVLFGGQLFERAAVLRSLASFG